MKKLTSLFLASMMVLSLSACSSSGASSAPAESQDSTASTTTEETGTAETGSSMDDLIAAAQAEGELIVYGSCEEEYLAVACENFEKLYGIDVQYQRLSTGEVQSKIEEENGNPSADVWFGGTTDPYNVCAAEGLLMPYEAQNASHLLSDAYRDADGNWYGI